MDNETMQGRFTEVNSVGNQPDEGVQTIGLDVLALDIPDDQLVDIIDARIEDSRHFFSSRYDLFDRRKNNEIHYFGRQILQKEKERLLKDYESKYMDNVLWEIGATLKPLAMSRLPDLIVTPGNDSEDSVLTAQEVSKAIDTEIKERDNRRVLGLSIKHLPVYFTGVIKVRWDPEIDDYVFEAIHPDMIDVDHTATSNDADQMQFVSQVIPLTVQEILMRFPKKRQEFLNQLRLDGLLAQEAEPSENLLATTVRFREVWFTDYIRHTDKEWERVEGVCWKYRDVILGKMRNPNFDYEGETRYFSYADEGKRSLNEQELAYILQTGQLPPNVKEEKVFHNYFKVPRKPFYFLGYDQWGVIPYDETSWLEQNLQNQKSLDKRGKQLEETLDNRGHNVFSKQSGLTPADVEELDMNDPDEDLVVDGDVNETHKYIEPPRPSEQEFEEIGNIRNRMYSIAGSNAVRGQIQSPVATTNQIAREADFTRADDYVEDTINGAAEWMAEWALQMVKLRYTVDHFRDILGSAGDIVWLKLNRNMVADGMLVKVKASGTDKLRAQNNAMDMAKMQMTDPYTFFVDMGLSDPEGRTEKLILAKIDPTSYLQKVVKGLNTPADVLAALTNMQNAQQSMAGPLPQPQAQQPGGELVAPGQPQNPTPTNTAQVPSTPPAGPPQGSPRVL